MKKYLVVGNPIEHSLSPKLHNFWFKKYNIEAIYEKKLIEKNELENLVSSIKIGEISGANITVPYKKEIISYIDKLSPEAQQSQSVNTIYKENDKIIGHNTDIAGFELALRHSRYDIQNKKILILGAGGVVSSIILALKKMKASKIIISNRTKKKAEDLKKSFQEIEIINWGNLLNFDMIINATSIGLNIKDNIKLDFSTIDGKKFFYDIIYNPKETNFLKKGKELGHRTENGKMMFIYQAHQSFTIWNKVMPEINKELLNLIN